MKEKIRVVGGHSWFNRISMLSTRFYSIFWVNPFSKEIVGKVEPIPKAPGLFLRWPAYLPVIRLVRMTIFLFYTFPSMGLIWIGSLAFIAFLFPMACKMVVTGSSWLTMTSWPWLLAILFGYFVGTVFMLFLMQPIRPWHGAEHKTIAAYLKTESIDLDAIKKESPIDKRCGSRLLAPFMLQFPIVFLVWSYTGIPLWILYLGSLELIFQLDAYFGFVKPSPSTTFLLARIPPFSWCAVWVQKYLTVGEPSYLHLEVATWAMKGLTEAHETGKGEEYSITIDEKDGRIGKLKEIPLFLINLSPKELFKEFLNRKEEWIVAGLACLGVGIALCLNNYLVLGISLAWLGASICLLILTNHLLRKRDNNKKEGR